MIYNFWTVTLSTQKYEQLVVATNYKWSCLIIV